MNIYEVYDIMESSKRKIWLWLAVTVIASILSFLSYNLASVSDGRYVIWTGGIFVGLLNSFRSLSKYLKCKKVLSKHFDNLNK